MEIITQYLTASDMAARCGRVHGVDIPIIDVRCNDVKIKK
jgi:hypothetical protein